MLAGRFAYDQPFARVTVVARDAAGSIIAGSEACVDNLPAGGVPVPFETWRPLEVPGDAAIETYPARG